jgi:NAD(P)-dependent dehydrogenase (short-subunit alcohol dehydrogenase family)
MDQEEWHFTIRNELDIVFYATQLAWPLLIARGGGAILNTASVSALRSLPAVPGGAAHAAAKGGIIAMSRELAAEGGQHNIRVNSLSPGLVPRPGHGELFKDLTERTVQRQLVKRSGTPEDIAKAALFLLSDDSSFITGIDLVVDGGYLAT